MRLLPITLKFPEEQCDRMDMPPYSLYKPSSVKCLGNLPEHWNVRRLHAVVDIRVSNVDKHTREDEVPVRLCNYVDVYKNDRITRDLPFMSATASPDEIERFRLRRDDVLITKDSEAWDDIGVPALVTESADDLLSGYHLALLRPRKGIIGAYLALTLQSRGVACQFHVGANGVTRYGLAHFGIKSVRIPLPPLPEQNTIVRYLDYVDRRIRHYIQAKERLIALLKEERQAVVSQAVTRGLDPGVPLKPSGISELGDVPAHWELMPLKRLGRFRSGSGFPIDEQGQQSLELPFFKVSDMNLPGNDRVMTIQNNSVSHRTAGRLGAPVFPAGTIVFPKVGGALLTNKRRVVERPCCIDNNLMGCVVRHGNPQFVLLLLEHIDLATIAKPGPVPAISEGEVRGIRTAVPPLFEQDAIVAHLDKATADIDTAIARARRHIELLHEYRICLIADVVTGKFDVREAAAKLPNTDSAPLDESETQVNAEAESRP